MDRFISMQRIEYPQAFNEIKRGRKISHWIWYIFPQIKGLGHSYMCQKYDIQSLDEAKKYLENEYLRNHLIEISKELLKHKDKDIKEIMNIDDIKLLSCMTLFKEADKEVNKCGNIFQDVINTFYGGKDDVQTLSILEKQKIEKIQKLDNIIEEEKIKINKEKKDLSEESSHSQDEEEMNIGNENIKITIRPIRYYERKNTNDLNNLSKNNTEVNKEAKEIHNNINYGKNNQPNDNIIVNKNYFEGTSMRRNYINKNNRKNEYQTEITDFFKKTGY
jgi:uncharacterized protein (DUF1810 family)